MVLEKERNLGGAWSTISIDEFEKTDSHCHIFVQDYRAYKIMEKDLGFSLIKSEPQPVYFYRGYKFHYNSFIRYLVAVIEPIFVNKKYKSNPSVWDVKNTYLSEACEFLKILWQVILSFFIKDVRYTKGGCNEIINKLKNKILELDGEILTEQDNQHIYIDDDGQYIISNEEKYTFEYIYMSTGTHIKEIATKNNVWIPKYNINNSYDLYLILNDKKTSPIPYMYMGTNKMIGRLFEPKNNNKEKRLVIAQLKNKYYEATRNDPSMRVDEDVFNMLKSEGILDQQSLLLKSKINTYKSYRLIQDELSYLKNNYSEHIKYMHVTNIARGICESYRMDLFGGNKNLKYFHYRTAAVRELGVKKLINWLIENKHINSKSVILDYGCGEFDLGKKISNKVKNIDGYDIRKDVVTRCRKKYQSDKSEFYSTKKEIKKNHYNLIVLNGVVQYIKDEEEFVEVLKYIKKWLRDEDESTVIITGAIDEHYDVVKDVYNWLNIAFKNNILFYMLVHIIWGGILNVLNRNNKYYKLKEKKFIEIASGLDLKVDRLEEDLTYSNTARSTYLLNPK